MRTSVTGCSNTYAPCPFEFLYRVVPVLTPVTPVWQVTHAGSEAHGTRPAEIVEATFAMSPWQVVQFPLSEVWARLLLHFVVAPG